MEQRNNYENQIRNHVNYHFIPKELKSNWVSASKNGVNPRTIVWDNKLKELLLSGELKEGSTLTNVARYIHPTKIHICKMCDQECSIFYVYPTKTTWKWLEKQFGININQENKFYTIFQLFISIQHPNKVIQFTKYFGKSIEDLEYECYNDKNTGKKLSPGVMGNPPDRLDGFHCYNNICGCRKTKDKGRSDENMQSYTRDRRAYEMMSDGNVLLANAVMGKLNTKRNICFICGKEDIMTADHIGPISLGFVHDPCNFQACCASCNSSKNNRLTQEDVHKILCKEEQGMRMVSWWAKDCWDQCKNRDIKIIHKKLNENAKKMLCIIEWFKMNKQDVLEKFIQNDYMNHIESYKIENIEFLENGDFTYKSTSSITKKKTKTKQRERTLEILLEKDNKINRKLKYNLTNEDIKQLSLCDINTFRGSICKVLAHFL